MKTYNYKPLAPANASPINNYLEFALLTVLLLPLALWLLAGRLDLWKVVLPTYAMVMVAATFVYVLWKRDGHVPIFDLGAVTIAFMSFYVAIPLLMFIVLDGEYSILNARQLRVLNPTVNEMAELGWWYVIFVGSYSVSYLATRGHSSFTSSFFEKPDKLVIRTLVTVFIIGFVIFSYLRYAHGVDFTRSYDDDIRIAGRNAYLSLPYGVRQIVHNFFNIYIVAKLGLLIILLSRWHDRKYRGIALLWLGLSLINYLMNMGARTYLFVFALGFIMLYHLLVKPFRANHAVIVGIVAVSAFFVIGWIRAGEGIEHRLHYLTSHADNPAMVSNEFETLFAGTFDWYYLHDSGQLEDVPWQVYVYDVFLLVPSQLLPFEKVNPNYIYRDTSHNPGYFMFNPICQSIIGFGIIELILRGLAVGWVYAKIHRWCASKPVKFWRLLLYLTLTVWSFYTIRSSTFKFAYRIIYHFLPLLFFYYVCKTSLRSRSASQNSGLLQPNS